MIRGIIFDCFGVLYGGSLSTLVNMCPADKLDQLRDLSKQSDYGYIDRSEYVEGVATLVGSSPDEITELLRHKHIRNEPLVEFVAQLKGQYKIGLLSNVGAETIQSLFTQDELNTLFDVVVLSNEEHITKPHPEIFKLTAERMGLTAGECIMIDDLDSNCEGAEIAGMQSIMHTTNDTTRLLLSKILKENA